MCSSVIPFFFKWPEAEESEPIERRGLEVDELEFVKRGDTTLRKTDPM